MNEITSVFPSFHLLDYDYRGLKCGAVLRRPLPAGRRNTRGTMPSY